MSASVLQEDAQKESKKTSTPTVPHHKHHASANLHPVLPTTEVQPQGVFPKGCKPLSHQVAGHRYGQGRLKLGMLQHADGTILKPVQPFPRGECEVKFYSKVFDTECSNPVFLTLRPFLPKFLGVCSPPVLGEEEGSPVSYIKLEDACRRYRNPSILDVKIGRVSYDPNADAAKIAFESGKYPPQMKLGFQLLGMRVSGQSPNEAIFYDKKWGRSLTEESITDGLEIYFSGNKACRKHLIKAFLQRLETILMWFESQSQLQFYSSSLLFIYDGEFFDGSSDSDEEFIHKYRSYAPQNLNESYRAIDKVLQSNMIQSMKNDTLKEANETNPSNSSRNIAHALNTNQSPSTKEKVDETKDTAVAQEIARSQGSHKNVTHRVPNGNESGYSSEVDSKKKNAVRSEEEFVNSLSNKMHQHRLTQCSKYRFPPDLVDVRMIDFTHIFEENCKDDNYIYGLRNLIAHLRLLLKRS